LAAWEETIIAEHTTYTEEDFKRLENKKGIANVMLNIPMNEAGTI
jgi:hypothetical protein